MTYQSELADVSVRRGRFFSLATGRVLPVAGPAAHGVHLDQLAAAVRGLDAAPRRRRLRNRGRTRGSSVGEAAYPTQIGLGASASY